MKIHPETWDHCYFHFSNDNNNRYVVQKPWNPSRLYDDEVLGHWKKHSSFGYKGETTVVEEKY